MLVRVTDLDDPRLDDYRNLRDKRLEESGAFIAESEVVLRVLVRRRTHPVRSVLLAEGRVAKLEPLLAGLDAETPVLVAAPAALDAITGFHFHRGVLAAALRTPVPSLAAWLAALGAGPATVIVLERLTNHDNVGSVFRNAAALGATGVVLDGETCDPLYRKAIRVSVGACLTVPYARCAAALEALAALRAAGFTVAALTPNEPARDLAAFARQRPERVALVLGSEMPGLDDVTLAAADVRVRIPQRADFDSLNVATASGIALYELSAQRAAGVI